MSPESPLPSPAPQTDLLVVGAGPAGLALAAAAAEAGLSVLLVDPAPRAPWPANYGVWVDEAEALDLPLAARWARPLVHAGTEVVTLPRAYGQVDRLALQAALWDRAEAAGVEVIADEVTGARHEADRSTVGLRSGPERTTWVVCDCSGHRPVLVDRTPAEATAFQTAWGELVDVDAHPWADGEMAFMDFRRDHLDDDGGPPTFLYAMPAGPGRVFVEETALAARPLLDRDFLEARLRRRLDHLGITVRARHETEWCVIPMDAAVPPPQRVLGLGGAASMVHPATGYSVVTSLSTVPGLVARLAADRAAGLAPGAAVAAAWEVVWTPTRRDLWDVLRFGREAMLSLDAARTDDFFAAFFATDVQTWGPFLAGTCTPREAAGTMLEMFRHAPTPLRLALTLSGFSPEGLGAARAMLWPSH